MTRVALVLAAALAAALVPLGGRAAAPRLELEPCRLAGGLEARCGRLSVPEDRARPDGRRISLRVAVLPARDGGSRPDPLVYLAGGPGGSAVDGAAGIASVFAAVNARRDVLLVDQRGTGGSGRLTCPAPATRRALGQPEAVRALLRSCLARLDADPRRYTSLEAADDLAAVAAALGYRRVNLYGLSYGATAAQYVLARHPRLVRSAILDGATLLDVPIFERWAPNGERALRRILARCDADPRCARAYPRARQEAFEVVAALRRRPVRADGRTIDAAAAAGALQALSRSPEGASQLPWVAHRARAGDWTPLLLALDAEGGGLAAAARQVAFWSVVCAEPWARMRPAPAAAAARGTYLADWAALQARTMAAACAVVPSAPQPRWAREGARSDVPVLFVAGGADPQDPPANLAGAARSLPNARTVVVPEGGHGAVQLGCVPALAARFLERGSARGLDTRCAAAYRPPRFGVAG
jgi:pimeloyl-ACP methyl ester carboxylesterase